MAKYKFNDDIPVDEVFATMRAVERYANTAEYVCADVVLAILGIEKMEEESNAQ